MIRYTVVWNELALDELAEAWLAASNREAVAVASQAIENDLSVDAPAKGEALHEGLRAIRVAPLKALFSVRESDRIVEITTVRGE